MKHQIRTLLSLTAAGTLCAAAPNAFTPNEYDGYTYMAIGINSTTYKEHVKTQSGNVYDSEATSNDVYYLTGGLLRLTETFDFSYDLASTLYANDVTEDVTYNGTPLENQADLLVNNMSFLLHYKQTPNHRIVGGLRYVYNTYKRFDFQSDPEQGVIEERSASLIADVGYWYESAPSGKGKWRYNFKATVGLPVWQKTSNTYTTTVTFSDTDGYNADAAASVHYTFLPGFEIGLTGGYSYMYREGGGPKSTLVEGVVRDVYWPENRLSIWYGALTVTWNFPKN